MPETPDHDETVPTAGIKVKNEQCDQATVLTLVMIDSGSQPVEVHAVIRPGSATFTVSGTSTSAMPETRDRVIAAIANSGLKLPDGRITVRLTSTPNPQVFKGSDLAIAVAVLTAAEIIRSGPGDRVVYVGELALNGDIRSIPDAIYPPHLTSEKTFDLVVATDQHVSTIPGADGFRIHRVSSLSDVIALSTRLPTSRQRLSTWTTSEPPG